MPVALRAGFAGIGNVFVRWCCGSFFRCLFFFFFFVVVVVVVFPLLLLILLFRPFSLSRKFQRACIDLCIY